jgi:hypothetical protein
LSLEEEGRLEDLLPWYVNGTLSAEDSAWVEDQLESRPALTQRLEREWALRRTVRTTAQWPAPDIGMERLMTRLQLDAQVGSGSRRQSARPPVWARWLQVISTPPVAGAMAVAVLAQAGVIAWEIAAPQKEPDVQGLRSIGVTEARTLRISFKPEATEAQIRAALVAAGARIVGGPTQLGEYWVASGSVSLDEIRSALAQSQITASMEVDKTGPRGR